jgi:hypothetical protein
MSQARLVIEMNPSVSGDKLESGIAAAVTPKKMYLKLWMDSAIVDLVDLS